jgi:competence protein ComEC
MRFPALALAASLAAGILADGLLAAEPPPAAHLSLFLSFVLVAGGLVCVAFRQRNLAWVISLMAWFALGAGASRLEESAVTEHSVVDLVEKGQISLEQPLRWRGALRLDPLELPWGLRYVVDLESVQSSGEWMPASGGLRADYYADETSPSHTSALRAGDSVEVLVRARIVRNFANPGSFDYRVFLARQGIHLTANLRNAALIEQFPGPPPTLSHHLARWRGRLLRETDAMLPDSGGGAAVARAMLLGDRSFLDTEQVDGFRRTGAYHILVLSGLQVGILAAALLWFGRFLRLPQLLTISCTLAILWAYAGIVEDQPPIVRAVWMASFYLLGLALFRRAQVLNAIGLAAMVILIRRPSELTDASFLLSFLAVGAIGGIAAPWLDRTAGSYLRALGHLADVTRDGAHSPHAAQFRLDLRSVAAALSARLPTRIVRFAPAMVTAPCRGGLWLWETLVISAVIQFAMLPLMAHYFHRVSFLGLVANVPAVLLTAWIVPLGFLSLTSSLVWQPLGQLFGFVLEPSIGMLLWSIEAVARLPWSSYRVPTPPPAAVAAFLLATLFLAAAIIAGKRRMTWFAAPMALAGAVLIIVHPFPPRLEETRLEMTVLDVGQGDSIFLAFPGGQTMLVDAGGLPGSAFVHSRRAGIDIGEEVVSPYLWSRGLKRLDVVALTHAHQDHLGGLAALLENFQVGELWVGRPVQTQAYAALLAEARRHGVPVVPRQRGDTFQWGGVSGRVLWPLSGESQEGVRNDDSLVLRLEIGESSFLLAGDIERTAEQAMTAAGDAIAVDFLKVAHHGSRTSTTEAFLDAARPSFAAISVGETNPFGHPHPDVLRRLQSRGLRLYRTDRDGAITVITDGGKLETRAFLALPARSPAPLPEAASAAN